MKCTIDFAWYELIIATLLTILYITTGLTPIVTEWPSQFENRMSLTETIDPESTDILVLNAEFDKYINSQLLTMNDISFVKDPTLFFIEDFLEIKIVYKSDLINHLAWEHLDTDVSRVIENGDDCDSIAVIACSLLIYRGYDSYVAIGKWHAWVEVVENESVRRLFESAFFSEDWFLRWNNKEVQIREIMFLDFIVHNFLTFLLIIKITLLTYDLLTKWGAIREVYSVLIAMVLSPLPVLIFLYISNK